MPTLRELQHKGQQHKRTAKPFLMATGYVIHRKLSLYLTWLILKFFPYAVPNVLSWIMIIMMLIGFVLIGMNYSFTTTMIGFVLAYFAFLLDKSDGDIARYNGMRSATGVFLDELYHILSYSGLLLAVFFSLFESGNFVLPIMLVIWLSLASRYIRKSVFFVAHKTKDKVDYVPKPSRFARILRGIANIPIFKIPSIIERYDIVLFVSWAVVIASYYTSFVTLLYYLMGYVVFASIYVLRRVIILSTGGIEHEVENVWKGKI